MIKVQDWIASIPDEDKHVAYVGEGMSESCEFLLCGDGWEAYREWSFHLDMAFDPESITTRDSRQVVQTRVNSTQMKETASVTTDEVTTKETYTVHDEQVLDYYLTDVAPLRKTVGEEGIRLEWMVLRQHTALPGKLWATLRAVNETGDKVKKSAIMVFEVDAAICAVPAARPPVSEMEQIEARVAAAADTAVHCADRAEGAQRSALNSMYTCTAAVTQVGEHRQAAEGYAEEALYSAATAATSMNAAGEYAAKAAAGADNAEQQAAAAAKSAALATNSANIAEDARQDVRAALERCSHYTVQTEVYAEQARRAVEGIAYRRVNVRDYGAVGDGVADDRGAIIAAFEAAKSMLPCEVYFPAGTYGILSGITIEMEYGTGGLRVCGAGRDVTTIKYLDDYTSHQGWYAIRIWPVGRPNIIPSEDDYLHDISYTGLTVYDPDPIGHALNTAKGDPATEETHGFDIHCCKGVSVTDCQFITVGDEAIDICFCHDVVVMNNRIIGSPGAGSSGGAISIGDGCKGVVICGNTINGSAPDEVLEDGTVLTKSNAGIVVETPSGYPVQDVTIIGNNIRNVHGTGVILSAETAGASLTNAIVADNIISGCDIGIVVSGAQLKDNIKITNNVIADCAGRAIYVNNNVGNITICGNTIRNIKGNYAVYATVPTSRQYIADNVFENIEYGGLYCSGDVVLKDCVFNGLGTAETALSANTYGVYKISGTITVSGCIFKNVRMAVLKFCLYNVDYLDNTDIEVVDKTTGVVDGGGYSIGGTATKRIVNCSIIGGVGINQDGAIVQGTKFMNKGNNHVINVSANRVSITGCIIENDGGGSSWKAIYETDGYNHNLFANNIVNRGIVTKGAQTVAVNNIDTRVTA